MKVIWQPCAVRDLDGIRSYIAGDNPRAARNVVFRIRRAIQILKNHPEAGRTGRLPGTRELVVAGTAYILPYRIISGRVEIICVMHGAQEWPVQFPDAP